MIEKLLEMMFKHGIDIILHKYEHIFLCVALAQYREMQQTEIYPVAGHNDACIYVKCICI